LPPAYLQLADDDWYLRLYGAHFDGAKEFVQALVGNLPNSSNTSPISGGFLTFFDDVLTDVTPTTATNTIESELGQFAFVEADEYSFDSEGDLIPLETTGNLSRATATRQSSTPQAILSTGLFDPYERKAVRVTNIEFPFPGTDKGYSERPYNIEFSIKTVKSDQVLTHGFYQSPTITSTRKIGVVGLSDGKIYLTEDSYTPYTFSFRQGASGSTTAPHPKNFRNRAQYLLGRTNIADGNWHHVIIQQGYGDENLRTQIWVDGELDRQLIKPTALVGLDGTNTIRPYVLGFNSDDALLNSDFETSAWNFYPGRFIDSRTINLNYTAYQKSKPIKVSPMLATLNAGQQSFASGNRSKALMLYWWPVEQQFGPFGIGARDNGENGFFDRATFDTSLFTIDRPQDPPQEYFGWHVFPLSVTGVPQGNIVSSSDLLKPDVIINSDGYIDADTGAPRYLDLIKDIDISNFDAIFFRNFPEDSSELDSYVRDEVSDRYFNIKERDLYEDFLNSLREAVDTGISLFITNPNLAIDMGIIDRVEILPVFTEEPNDIRAHKLSGSSGWDYEENKPNEVNLETNTPSAYTVDLQQGSYFEDRDNNMKHRVINTIEYLTDDASYIWKDRAYYQHSDENDFGGADRVWEKFEYKLTGLQPGDEFLFGNPSDKTALANSRWKQTSFRAVPFENVKAGKVITAQPLKYWEKENYVDNPYANYAHSIALEPGDSLNGKPVGGKIFVTISEMFADYTAEYHIVDLTSDYWIDIAYENKLFGELNQGGSGQTAENIRDGYKNTNINRFYISPNGISQEHYDYLTYWSRNDSYTFSQIIGGETLSGVLGFFDGESNNIQSVAKDRKTLFASARARDALGRFASGSGGSGGLFFQITSGRQTDIMNVYVPNLLTRALWWLSDKVRPTGLVNRAQAMTASVAPRLAVAIVDKDASIAAQSMISVALFSSPVTGTLSSVSIPTLPMYASADIVALGKRVFADSMTSAGILVEPGLFTFALEEIVLKIENVEPVLYIRGDKIR